MLFTIPSLHSQSLNYGHPAIYSISPGVSREANWLNQEIEKHENHVSLPLSVQNDIRKFSTLASTWKTDTLFYSSMDQIVLHPAYQQIIGMGEKVVPFILCDLEESQAQWFWALKAITGLDPVKKTDRGDVARMTEAWVSWGKKQNYV